jgi:UDP-N-acetylbacillosamine N-acetyltransferase
VKKKIVIYGTEDLAKQMFCYLSDDNSIEISGFTVDRLFLSEHICCGLPVVAFEDIESVFAPHEYDIFVAIGYRSMRNRALLFNKVKSRNYRCASYISKAATVHPSVTLGVNNVIMAGCVIEPFVVIGDNNIFWSSSTVCHNAVVGDHNFISAGTVIGGFTRVGHSCFLGFHSTVREKIHVADETLVGAASLLLEDTKEYISYWGIPARPVGEHKKTGIVIER